MVRFGVFEFDQRSGELRKAGVRLALPDQSSRILAALLEQPGEVVSRKELRAQLWPADTFVDFEQGLNTAVRRLRETLGDSADAPRYIETLPRRGYRFIAPVDGQSPRPVREARSHGRLLLAATMVGVATFVLLTAYLTAPAAPPRPVVHLVANVHPANRLSSAVPLDSNPHLSFLRPSRTAIALSPDGRLLVFSGATGGATQLYVRRLASGEAEPLAGTAGADSPFFSPDGRWLGFWVEGQVRRVPIEGGAASVVCDADPLLGATWTDDDRIIFATLHGTVLIEVPAAGGLPQPLTVLSGDERSHRLPHAIPGTSALLFTVTQATFVWQQAHVELLDRSTGQRTTLVEDAADARYLATGHLIFARMGRLLAAPFDPSHPRITGPQVTVLDDVMHAVLGGNSSIDSGAAQVATSADGTLAYVPGGVYPPSEDVPILLDRGGTETPLGPGAGIYGAPRISPDGSRVAFFGRLSSGAAGEDILLYDPSRPRSMQRLTDQGQDMFPVWSPDGTRIAYSSEEGGFQNLFLIPADGSAGPERLTTAAYTQQPAGFTPDGQALLFVQFDPEHKADIWKLDLRDRHAEPVVSTRFNEGAPALSPDGGWLAYTSDRSGRYEVYVQPYPGPGETVLVSDGGGAWPAWDRSGRELFYKPSMPPASAAMPLLAVAVRSSPAFAADPPRILFTTVPPCCRETVPNRNYDIMPDGQFLMMKSVPKPVTPVTQVQIVLNWADDLAKTARAR